MIITWIVTIPPLIVALVAVKTKNVLYSLVGGIIAACLIASDFSLTSSLMLAGKSILKETQLTDLWYQTGDTLKGDYNHLYTWAFLIVLGMIITIMTHAGGIGAYTKAIMPLLHTKKSAQVASLSLSSTFFLDDYLNTLTTGAIMRPVTDMFKIPRIKLAFLLNSMSGPLCLLIPASSWVAFILSQLESSGLSSSISAAPYILADPLTTYIKTIPYILYALLIIASAWFIVTNNISFGLMHKQEQIAATTGNLFGGKQPRTSLAAGTESLADHSGSLNSFIIPISTFLLSIPLCTLYIAGWSPYGALSWTKAMQNADAIIAGLFYASVISFAITAIYLLAKKVLTPKTTTEIMISGFILMKNSLLLLLLAWTFGGLLKSELQTGVYLANLVINSMPLFVLPVMIFLTTTAITASTGSSWGTVTIMLPICLPMLSALAGHTSALPAEIALLYPTLGAIFSGIIAGSHISPTTDATVLAATSASCYHIEYVQSQIAYSLPALLSAALGFAVLPFLPTTYASVFFVLVCACIITATILRMQNQELR